MFQGTDNVKSQIAQTVFKQIPFTFMETTGCPTKHDSW